MLGNYTDTYLSIFCNMHECDTFCKCFGVYFIIHSTKQLFFSMQAGVKCDSGAIGLTKNSEAFTLAKLHEAGKKITTNLTKL